VPALTEQTTPALARRARQRRDRAWGRVLTWSPKVFLPLTNLCRNACDYCAFRKAPGQDHTMLPAEVDAVLAEGARSGCTEALFCIGDTPEAVFPHYRRQLDELGHDDTTEFLYASALRARAHGLHAHTNAGLLSAEAMIRLAEVNASLGLMLETTAELPVHRAAPDKSPSVRVRMLEEAGQLGIPFTTGLLVGIGETEADRVESLCLIRDIHRRFGHIMEVIVQPFRAHAGTPMAQHPEPDDETLTRAIALARLILDEEISVQSPPNLASVRLLVEAGVNDLGGISPVTPDFINADHPWPHVDALEGAVEGFELRRRLPLYGCCA